MEALGYNDTIEGARLHIDVGLWKLLSDECDEACHHYRKARRTFETLGKLNTADGASLAKSMAIAEARVGKLDSAAALIQDAMRFHEETSTLDTVCGAYSVAVAGYVETKRGRYSEALPYLVKARRMFQTFAFTTERAEDIEILEVLAFVQTKLGDQSGAAKNQAEANRIRELLRIPAGFSKSWVIGGDPTSCWEPAYIAK
jgi:tetratricopeptide (TPR) repeat protein